MSFRNTPSDIFGGLGDIDEEKSKVFPSGTLGRDASPATGGALEMCVRRTSERPHHPLPFSCIRISFIFLRFTSSAPWIAESGSADGMSDGTGSAQFGVDSGNWERDISQLVFMKFGGPPSARVEATSFWKLQDSTETDHAVDSGLFKSVETTSGSHPGASSAASSAAASNFSDKSGTAAADTCHAMDSPEHQLFERAVPARLFRSIIGVDSAGSGSVASMLEPRNRNSSATEFRSSSGTDVQVHCFIAFLAVHFVPRCNHHQSGAYEHNKCQRAF